jgi:hypothetical protein
MKTTSDKHQDVIAAHKPYQIGFIVTRQWFVYPGFQWPHMISEACRSSTHMVTNLAKSTALSSVESSLNLSRNGRSLKLILLLDLKR